MQTALTLLVYLSLGAQAGWEPAAKRPVVQPALKITSRTVLVPRRHTAYQASTAAANSGFNTQQLQQGFQSANQWAQGATQQVDQTLQTYQNSNLKSVLESPPGITPQRTIGGELAKGVEDFARKTDQVLRNTQEAFQGTGKNLADTAGKVLGMPSQPPAPAGSGRYNQYSYNQPTQQQQPLVTPAATGSQWASPQPQGTAQAPWSGSTWTGSTQQPAATQPPANSWSGPTGWGGATQPAATNTQPSSTTGWGGWPNQNNTTPVTPAAQQQGGFSGPSYNDNRWAANDSARLNPVTGYNTQNTPQLGTAAGGALPDLRDAWPNNASQNSSWGNQPTGNQQTSPQASVYSGQPQSSSWADTDWDRNYQPPAQQPATTNVGFGDRPGETGGWGGNQQIPGDITPVGPSTASYQQTNLNDRHSKLAWLGLLASLAFNFYVWWSYLEIRSKYLGSLRRGGNAYAA